MSAAPPTPERPDLQRRVLAELIAAFALIFCVGTGAAAAASGHADLGLPAQAAVSGLAITGLIYAVGHLSGAHINPAVTIAFTITRHFPRREALLYIGAQLMGAALAGLLLLAAWPDKPGHLGANAPSVATGTALVYEIFLTALLMFVIVAVATDTRAVGAGAAIAIGAVVVLDILIGGGVSGASMNPARSFGPALASGTWGHFWIYVIGPIAGAVLGGLAYQLIRAPATPPGSTPAVEARA
jgi:MIP family channel proteins